MSCFLGKKERSKNIEKILKEMEALKKHRKSLGEKEKH